MSPARAHVPWPSWVLLSATALVGALSALYVVITPAGEQTSLAGRTWAKFAGQDAEMASIVSRLLVVLGLLGMAFGLAALLIALIPYRRGQSWSWFALWLVPLMYGAIAVRQLTSQYVVGYFYAGLAAAGVVALLLSVRSFRQESK